MSEVPISVLTVGDGDLSYSLALSRAYGHALSITATTLLSAQELHETYCHAANNIEELHARGVRLIHGVDATALDAATLGLHDHVLFAHPHLGLADLYDVEAHSRRHQVLLAHFLASAAALLADSSGGCVHLTLCGNQPKAWRIEEHASRLGLPSPSTLDVASPPALSRVSSDCSGDCSGGGSDGNVSGTLSAAAPETGWAARQRFRNGNLGARHWLSRYGYEHRRRCARLI